LKNLPERGSARLRTSEPADLIAMAVVVLSAIAKVGLLIGSDDRVAEGRAVGMAAIDVLDRAIRGLFMGPGVVGNTAVAKGAGHGFCVENHSFGLILHSAHGEHSSWIAKKRYVSEAGFRPSRESAHPLSSRSLIFHLLETRPGHQSRQLAILSRTIQRHLWQITTI
jgi:hypothetical protein